MIRISFNHDFTISIHIEYRYGGRMIRGPVFG